MKYALIHSRIIVDGLKEYSDGVLLVDGERIVDVFPHTNKTDLSGYEIIDLKDHIIMPGFIELYERDNVKVYDPLKEEYDEEYIRLIGHSDALISDITAEYEGYADAFVDVMPLDNEGKNLSNLYFTDNRYITVDMNKLSDVMVGLLLRNTDRHRIILVNITDDHINRLFLMGISYMDMALYTSANACQLLKDNKVHGSLYRGKYADIKVLKDNRTVMNIYKGIINE